MMNSEGLKIVARGDRELIATREFNAPRTMVWDAFTKPELLRRWFLGPPGWALTVCDIDLKIGGAYRYVWRQESDGMEMGMGGVYREIESPKKLVTTEKFDMAWYPGGMVGTLELAEPVGKAGRTALTQTLVYDTKEARDTVLKSPMEKGMAAGFDLMDDFLAGLSAQADQNARVS